MTLDPKLFGENPARDSRFESKDRWHELPNYPHDDPRSSLEFLTRQMNEEVNATEMAARNLVDFPDAPWGLRMAIARQAAACRHSAGAQACASTRGTFSSVVWLWTSPEVSRRGLHAACGACSVGGAKPSRAGGRSALREPPFP